MGGGGRALIISLPSPIIPYRTKKGAVRPPLSQIVCRLRSEIELAEVVLLSVKT